MFDFTRVSRGIALLLAAYFVCVPVGAIAVAAWSGASGHQHVSLAYLWWPVPVIFAAGTVVLVVDFLTRLQRGRLSTTQVTGHRVAGGLMVVGSAFALASGHWIPVAVSAIGLGVLLLPTRGRAVTSTWEMS